MRMILENKITKTQNERGGSQVTTFRYRDENIGFQKSFTITNNNP